MIRTFVGFLLMAAALCAAPVSYLVSVDTQVFAGTNGQALFQFNPGGVPDLATAEVSMISGVAAYSENSRQGDVTGTDPWLLGNTQLPNLLLLDLTGFTNTFSFVVTLGGDAVENPQSFDGTAFTLTMLDSSGAPLAGFNDPSLWLDLSQASVTEFARDTQITVADVPEPGTVGLCILGLLVVAGRQRCFRG